MPKKGQVEGEISEDFPYIHQWECFRCGANGIIKGASCPAEEVLSVLCDECDPNGEWEGDVPEPSRYN